MIPHDREISISKPTVFSPLIGSLVEFPPLFSHDSKFLYTIWKNEICSFSTSTGELIQNFDGIENPVGLVTDPQNIHMFIACSTTGQIGRYINEDSVNIKTRKLDINEDWTIRWFDLFFNEKKAKTIVIIAYEIVGDNALRLATYYLQTGEQIETLSSARASFSKNSISIGNDIIASIYEKSIYFNNILPKNRKSKTIEMSMDELRCVSVGGNGSSLNPTLVAAGDVQGAIFVWTEPLDNDVEPAKYHWHHSSLNCVSFSSLSSTFYSGGSESVFVKWTMGRQRPSKFLPRLSGEIAHIVFSNNNTLGALSLTDNTIQIVSLQTVSISACIQHIAVPNVKILDVDPTSNGLVLGGREGQIQVYNHESNTVLYHLDITMINTIASVGNQIMRRPEVKCVAFSRDRNWLATSEETFDSFEVRLKFWRIVGSKYSLATHVEHPHPGGITSLAFSPCNKLCVTCGGDKRFRVWKLTLDGQGWRCAHVGTYHQYACATANFSVDGSVLGVAFESTLTLWARHEMKLNGTLTPLKFTKKEKPPIHQVHFGGKDPFSLVGTSYHRQGLYVWDVMTLSLLWELPLEVTIFSSNHTHTNWAIFASNHLFIFDASKQNLKHKVEWTWKSEPVAATFDHNCNIFILDDEFHLYKLNQKSESRIPRKQVLFEEYKPMTPFSKMNAEKQTSAVERIQPKQHHVLGNDDETVIKQFLDTPSYHAAKNCNFLYSLLLIPKKEEEEEPMEVDENVEEIEVSSEEEFIKEEKEVEEKKGDDDDDVTVKFSLSELAIKSDPSKWIDLIL